MIKTCDNSLQIRPNTHTIIPILPYSITSFWFWGSSWKDAHFISEACVLRQAAGARVAWVNRRTPVPVSVRCRTMATDFHPASSGSGQASSLCLTALYRDLTCSNMYDM